MKLTLSVRSFQVPATPGTLAWPPSLPSVPTSRDTRVTSEAKARSWSTIVLTMSLSSRISPFTSTVILRDRSPVATALVTSAMLRTWLVRLLAMKLTLSVRSFQVPATPGTAAWPPSLPSVPTSRATRVTSEAKARSWSTVVLIVSLSSRISPFTSTVIFLDRSPLAIAVVTAAMLRTWTVRLLAIRFTLSVRSFQVPATPFTSRLAAQLALGADLARHARHLGGERAELLDHRVHDARGAQELAGERTAVEVEGHRLREVALGHGADDARRLGGRVDEVGHERVHALDGLGPRAAHVTERGALVDLAFLADGLAQPRELGRQPLVRLDRLVEGVGDLAGDARPFLRQPSGEVAFLEGVEGGEQLARVQLAMGACENLGSVLPGGPLEHISDAPPPSAGEMPGPARRRTA